MAIERLVGHFGAVVDPRGRGKVEHRLPDILVIAVCAVIPGGAVRGLRPSKEARGQALPPPGTGGLGRVDRERRSRAACPARPLRPGAAVVVVSALRRAWVAGLPSAAERVA